MTNPIEFAARKAKAGLTGASPTGDAAQQSHRGSDLIRNMATGGLALGAGAGALVSLLNYLKSMREEEAVMDEERLNDDTLYIPTVKSAAEGGDVNRWLAPGLALTGGILSAGGSYALTQAIYSHLQKKHRQRMLDEAQGEALLASDQEIAKAAAGEPAKMDFYELATAFPVAVPLLAALASGGVAYAALQKTFPTVRAPKSKYPRRIRQVAQNGAVSDLPDDVDPIAKSAADYVGEADLEAAAGEFLILTVDRVAMEKGAAFHITSDILNRVAKDGLSSVAALQKEGGLAALTEAVRGASDEPADLASKVIAAAAICKSARLAPVMTALASAEFQELAPDLYETALSYGEDQLDKIAGIAPLMQLACFRPLMLTKSAASNPLLAELAALPGILPGFGGAPGLDEAALTSDVNGSGAVDSEGSTIAGEEDEGGQIVDEDPVDELLASEGEASPILDPVREQTGDEEDRHMLPG